MMGYLLSRIQVERIKAMARNRPMAVLTGQTPTQVQNSSCQAAAKVFGLSILALITLAAGFGSVYLVLGNSTG
jgi:hypothetical protein